MKSLIAAIAAATGSETKARKRGQHSRATRLLALSLLSPICVVAAAETQRFDIPSQPLPDALKVFADQARMQLLYKPEALSNGMSTSVVGDLEKHAALELLLKGTGFEVVFSKGNAATIRPASSSGAIGANTLPISDASEVETVTVFGTLDNMISVGSKNGLTLRETPKSVTIVTRERIEAQNLTTVTDVLKQATGITVRPYDPVQSWYYSRGYRVESTQLDGGAPITADFGNFSSPDSAMFERVEVLRGVDGMFSGAGDPGGVINLVRKRASSEPSVGVTVSAGSWNNYRAEVDVTGALASDGRVRGRAVGVFEDKDYFWDRADANKKMVYAIVESDIGESTVLSGGGSYETRRDNGYWYGGVPRYANGRDLGLSRSTSLVPDWGYSETTTKEVFAKLEHSFNSDLALAMNVTHQDQKSETLTAYTEGPINPVTLTGATFNTWADDTPSKRTAVDLHLKGTFQLFSREHRFAVGTDYSVTDGGGARFFYMMGYPFDGPSVDVFNFNPALLPRPVRELNPAASTNRIRPVYGQTQYGAYVTAGLQLTDPMRLTLGARYTEYEQEEQSYRILPNGTRGPTTSYYAPIYSEHALVPSVAVTYELGSNWSAYASYAETFKPQGGLLKGPEPGVPLDPITGGGLELGLKGEMFDNVNTSLAVYSVKRIGEGLAPGSIAYGAQGKSCCYIDSGDITMQGVDVEFSGVILPGWQLFAGYTYGRQKLGPTSAATEAAASFNFSPKHLFKMWTTWRLPGVLANWTVNTGVTAQSEILMLGNVGIFDSTGAVTGTTPYRFEQAGYALWNASVEYRVSEHWSAALYADNLFDKIYYAAVNSAYSGNIYGAPRNFTLRLQAKF